MSNTTMREYKNTKNGGRERVYRIDGKYFINSDWGRGFSGELKPVSRHQMYNCLQYTKAPDQVITDILGDTSDLVAAEPERDQEVDDVLDQFDGGRGAGSLGQQID